MTCQDLTRLVGDYVEGRMTGWDRLRFQFHLGLCDACRGYLRQMEQAHASIGRMPAEEPPEHVRDELLKRFRTWKGA
jgi:predicted anti-sigma-YlaC factor YlaD